MERFVSAADLHGDRQDKPAVKAFIQFVADFKPQLKVFKGDIFDLRAIREGANKEEKRHSMLADFEAGMEFLEAYKPHVITLGNHDQRLYDLIEKGGLKKSGPLTDLAITLEGRFEKLAKKFGTLVLPYDKRKGVWSHKGLKFTHGFSQGSNAATEMAKVYGNVLFGHGHAIDVASEPGDEPRIARMTGCLCQLDMDYNRAQLTTLRQQHGWAYGAFFGGRRFEVMQASVQHNQVVYADHLKVISA